MVRKLLYVAAYLLSLAAAWIVAVDWSWFIHSCPDCVYQKEIYRYRVFTFTIDERIREFPTSIQLVGEDLGVPCPHRRSVTWHKHRWWGLCFCYAPCINGITGLSSDNSWHNQDVSSKIAELARDDPSVKEEYVQRVYEDHEFENTRKLLARAGVNPVRPSVSE